MLSRAVLRDLERQVGTTHLYSRPADLAAYAFDAYGASGLRADPEAVVFPASTDEVAGVLATCSAHGVPVTPRGAGTGYAGGAVASGGVVLVLTRLVGATLEREAQLINAAAGTTTAAVHAAAAAAGLYYPPDPGSATTSTIGGNVATNAGGPHALRYGSTADFVAGLTAVLMDGRVLHLGEGGEAAHLVPLLCGSEGTLAVVTETLLRLIPAPAARATLSATFAGMAEAAGAVAAISEAGVVPSALEFLDRNALDAIATAGAGDVAPGAGALLIVEVEGGTDEVAAHGEAVRHALAASGAATLARASDAGEARRLWQLRTSVSAAVAAVQIGKVNEDVVVPRDRVAELVERTRALGVEHHLPVVTFGHLGDGNIHTTFLVDPRVPSERRRAEAAVSQLFDHVLSVGGSLSGEHGVGVSKLAFAERQLGAAQVELMRRLKSQFDPRGLLNPGKKIPAPVAVAAVAETMDAHAAEAVVAH
ncbi:MAG: FAD-binding oxidoreductase [Candidatus Dormibacteria bacterium]